MRWTGLPRSIWLVAGQAWSERQIVILSIAWTWSVYLALIAARLALIHFPRESALLGRTCLTAAAGAVVTWCVYLVLRLLRYVPFIPRVVIAATLVVFPAAIALTFVNYQALYVFAPQAIWSAQVLSGITLNGVVARTLPEMYFLLASWAALYGSVTGALQSRDVQRRAAALQAEVYEAQLRALRYQLNPHFLFNALNSLSALVMLGDRDRAEHVIQLLSAFLRSTLEGSEARDTTLAEEIAVQRLYLEIEQVRFRDRLRIEWLVPEELGPAELPPLLLQPIIENVLRHAVAPASAPVTMAITACIRRDKLHVAVEDNGHGRGAPGGIGIGLRNVASRLKVRYGDAARCDHGPLPAGGFRVEVVLPLHVRAAEA